MYFLSFIFLFFFIYIFGLGPTRPSIHFIWVGPSSAHMGWDRPSRPARPGHWSKPVPLLGCVQVHAWSEFTRALNCEKVIKLPSHSVLATKFEQKNENGEERHTCFCKPRRSLQNSDDSRLFPSVFPFRSCAPRSTLFLQQIWEDEVVLQSIWEDERINSEDVGLLWMSIAESSLISLVAGIKQRQGQFLFVCMLLFFFALYVLLCFSFPFLCFFLVFWVGSSYLLFLLCIISLVFLLFSCSGSASLSSALHCLL